MNKKITIIILVAVVAVAAILMMNRGNDISLDTSPSPSASPASSASPEVSATASASPASSPTGQTTAVKEFTVNGTPFKYDPAEIKVKLGDKVRIVFKNQVGFHDWVLDEFNAKTKQIQAGQQDTIEFIASKKGTFEYYCSVGTHRQQGMIGKLIVE